MNTKQIAAGIFIITITFLVLFGVNANGENRLKLNSPSGNLKITISIDSVVSWSLRNNKTLLINPSKVSVDLSDGTIWGKNAKLKKTKLSSHQGVIYPVMYFKNNIVDNYNELLLQFKQDFDIVFRAYDDGIAYRFVAHTKKPFIVENEQVQFNFVEDTKAYYASPKGRSNGKEIDPFYSSFQNTYNYTNLSEWEKDQLAFLPVLVENKKGVKMVITESDLIDYPGLYLKKGEINSALEGVFPEYPKKVVQKNMDGVVESRESYIAKKDGATSFPWRTIIVADQDMDLLNNDMVYKLATPAEEADFSWIKPGKVAWDWWNDWNIYGVDFKAGVNNETYKYYIDFASSHNIEYVILDEGWAVAGKADLFQIIPEIDLEELIAYGNERNVGIILWAGFKAFDKDMDKICSHFSNMGVKGFKVDFMNRDDQYLNNFLYRAAKATAKYRMLIDFHGTAKPAGLNRTFPNVINFEGVFGLEELKWAKEGTDMVEYDVTMPFIRMLAGPVDYTQGAMNNANKQNFRTIYSEAMSQGTRIHQLAEYIVFNAPLSMLCDAPTNYIKEKECTDFIAGIPTVWEETIPLKGEISKYVAMARRSGDTWYVGALTNWEEHDMELDLSFLKPGKYQIVIFKDGINANRVAKDYKKEIISKSIGSTDQMLKIHLASGGGFVAMITKQ